MVVMIVVWSKGINLNEIINVVIEFEFVEGCLEVFDLLFFIDLIIDYVYIVDGMNKLIDVV